MIACSFLEYSKIYQFCIVPKEIEVICCWDEKYRGRAFGTATITLFLSDEKPLFGSDNHFSFTLCEHYPNEPVNSIFRSLGSNRHRISVSTDVTESVEYHVGAQETAVAQELDENPTAAITRTPHELWGDFYKMGAPP